MTYKPCRNCDFWVTQQDAHCPNCGAAEPRRAHAPSVPGPHALGEHRAKDANVGEEARAFLGGVLGAVVGGGVGGIGGMMVGLAVGVALGVQLHAGGIEAASTGTSGRNNAEGLVSTSPSSALKRPCLRRDEHTIQQRLEALDIREKQIAEARQRVEAEGDAPEWETVRATLDRAETILHRQRDRYRTKLWEIALVRWQNTLEPIAADWATLTHQECNDRLQTLDVIQKRGRALLEPWQSGALSRSAGDESSCLARLHEALELCEQLRQALVVRQAALAVKGIAPLSDAFQPDLAPARGGLIEKADAFNARASIGEFHTAFGELEAEYARLQAEDEMADRAAAVNRLG